MSYWGSRAEESDFAFDAVGVVMLRVKMQMFKDIEVVQGKVYPEQSILASLVCLRLLGERFPKNLIVHFRRKDLEEAKDAFQSWYLAAEKSIPPEYKSALLMEADSEFRLFDELLPRKKGTHSANPTE